MFPPGRTPMGGGPGFFGRTPFQIGQGMNPYGAVPKQGFLTKLFSGAAGRGAQGGLGAGVTRGGTDFASMLGNMQQVMKVAQTATPMIQQYGPMVKNLPMLFNLWKIMREPDEEDQEEDSTPNNGVEKDKGEPVSIQPADNRPKVYKNNSQSEGAEKVSASSRRNNQGTSQPKLYI
ncbi:VrrA/YqfQ family protein [Thalassobacillus pellis]|uniref:VrrA/YqfQ family protein n=1 Tax=Thalassobacillus pellis TaxID=748008 RepID=UPI001961FBA8|nr:VrrA/YqfQ family protein [Thalassobacillus pellis]MBM7552539.1 hypothetical protein [Thalassobacillus pellis]